MVENSKGVQKGITKIIVNGKEIKGNLIPETIMKDYNEVVVEMG
jgi:hypothetical protein